MHIIYDRLSAVYAVSKSAREGIFGNLKSNDQRNQIFKEARRIKSENQVYVGDKCVKDVDGNLALNDKSKLATWKNSCQKLLNVEFSWESSTSSRE